jgi:hypothetical protein
MLPSQPIFADTAGGVAISSFAAGGSIIAKAEFCDGRTLYVTRPAPGLAFYHLAEAVRRELATAPIGA